MPNIVSEAGDGWTRSTAGGDFGTQRNSAGYSATSNNTRDSEAIANYYFSMRGNFAFRRSFLTFDTEDIEDEPSSAILKIYGFTSAEGNVIAVKSAHGATLDGGDFRDGLADVHSDVNTALTASDGISGGTFAGISNFTYMDSPTSSWSTSGYNNMTLNGAALHDMVVLDDFKVCLMNYDYDYLDVENTSGLVRNGLWWADGGGSEVPTLSYTVATAAENATFFGANF